ncbi:MAG TPA: GNAT family protein [Methanomassiliicoccales archaeon]|nr:GNAT family protein [Methanomassiliicoccales archaeon]
MLQGKLVRLRAVERADLPAFVRWFNDLEVTRFLLRSPPMGMEEEERWFEHLRDREERVFSIETLDGKLIGNIGIIHVDYHDRKADIGIAIGEKDHWSRGYGRDAINVLLGYMFDEMNLERVWLYADQKNERAVSCYEKCGFKREGLLRHNHFKNDEYADDVIMAVIREDWRRAHPL